MATVIGTSGAWKDVLSRLKMLDVTVSHPDEIIDKLQGLKQNRLAHVETIRQTLTDEIQTLKQDIVQCEARSQQQIQACRQNTALKINQLYVNIEQCQDIFQKKMEILQAEIDEHTDELAQFSCEQVPVKIQREVSHIIEEAETKLVVLEKQSEATLLKFTANLSGLEQQLVDLHQAHPENLQQLDDLVSIIETEYQVEVSRISGEIKVLQATLNPQIVELNEQSQSINQEKVGIFKRIANWFKQWFLYRQQQVILSPLRQLQTAENAATAAKNRRIREVMRQRQKILDDYHEQLENNTYHKNNLFASKRITITQFERQRIEITQEKSEKLAHAKRKLLASQQNKIDHLRQQLEDAVVANVREIEAFKKQQQNLQLGEREEMQKIQNGCETKRNQLNYLLNNEATVIHERCYNLDYTVSALENVLKSHEFIGAKAELAVISGLAGLPTSYYVLNDVQLHARRYMKFNHKAIQSAQIDHLIVAPSGVFVVEVKNWSQQFVDSGNFFDPYEQLGRANRLCYFLLKERFGMQTKVRSILAYRGHLPVSGGENSKYIKILPLEEIMGYVRWFERQTPVLNTTQVKSIVEEFRPETSYAMTNELQHWGFS